ncbi:MAG: hypothetical protein A2542_01965 [Parcubacteria group bacterium RIFOXYD2_FULL_52_8]|nr:MAG: hypothetical protein A2542_01965 [Parcubacteria group bacterium RIFOXYD2_FULL_52_8]
MSKEILPESREIIKYGEVGEGERKKNDLFLIALVLLVGFLGFGLGRYTKIEEGREQVTITYPDAVNTPTNSPIAAKVTGNEDIAATASAASPGPIVASRNGTKYYYTWCSGASRITAKNRVYFATAALAEARGLTKASNCPGL